METFPYIVAIGTSAGGLEALSSFFENTPQNGVSYVIIPHLSPNFISKMAEILSRHSQLEILNAEEGLEVWPNKVYIIPNTKYMDIRDRKLYLTDKSELEPPHKTVDFFFKSLAADVGSGAISVILSGTGTDGAIGVRAIQQAGGIVMVQDPGEAQFNGMPLAALSASQTDYILPAQKIPQAIQAYIQENPWPRLEKPVQLSETFLEAAISLIKQQFPFDFTDYKLHTLTRRIKRRMEQRQLANEEAYLAILRVEPEETELMISDFLIGVTSFFRDPMAFDVLENEVIPLIVKAKSGNDIVKMWSACCATGEEAYSLAILVKECLLRNNANFQVKIFASDINKAALAIATKGRYPNSIQNSVSADRLERFFDKSDSGYCIKPQIRSMLIFAQHDLTRNPPYCQMDLISCRNMLIYIKPVLQKQVLAKLGFGLRKDGVLFLGSSESILNFSDDYLEISAKWKIYQIIRNERTPYLDWNSAPALLGLFPTSKPLVARPQIKDKEDLSVDLADATLSMCGYSAVTIDQDFRVTKAFGDLSPYLKQDQFNLNLRELLPDPLAVAFNAAVYKTSKWNQRVAIGSISYIEPGTSMQKSADLIVSPLINKKNGKSGMLVAFKPSFNGQVDDYLVEKFKIDFHLKENNDYLEHELSKTRQELILAKEFLDASKESMQSFNEELLSANEEMQSANEELQSINEELETVNIQHQSTIHELTDLNDDLNNYFRSNTNGQLFVDNDILLKKFSPSAAQFINLREEDIGRPLANITTNIKFDTLIDDIKTVVDTQQALVREVESLEGKIFQVTTTPYIRFEANGAHGTIITFYDITGLKKMQDELTGSNKSLLRINADLDNFVYTASHDLMAPINNIESVLSILAKKMDSQDPVVQKFRGVIDNSIRNFKAVIKDMTIIGSIEAEMKTESVEQNFTEIFDEICDSISDRISRANADITTDFEITEIKFPRKNLRSIILNLVTNALKFKHPARNLQLSVKTERCKECIVLMVKDNGIGIPKDRMDSIFKMYHRVNQDLEGQGMGLYLINKIMDASGGQVEVESEVGVGTSFKIYFKNIG